MLRLLSLLVVVIAVSICMSSVSLAVSFTPLGGLPGGFSSSRASGTSANGSVVVGGVGSFSGSLGPEAVLWDTANGIQGLGDLAGGPFSSSAQDVSSDGLTIVGFGRSTSGPEAFHWTSAGGIQGLGDLPGGGFSSAARSVSADGTTIVGRGTSIFGLEAFRWQDGTGLQGLGDLPGGQFFSDAYGVSNDGNVVAGRSESASGNEAFVWDPVGGMQGLGDLPGGNGFSEARGISGDGTTVVGYSDSIFGLQAFRWTAAGGMDGLGDLAGGTYFSQALDASEDGSTIVGFSTGTFGDEAFIWDAENGMRSLRVHLISLGVDLTGWWLLEALAISDDGRTVVGFGINPDGDDEAFMAVIEDVPICGLTAITGIWDVTVEEVSNNCGEPLLPLQSFTVPISQTGNVLTFGTTPIAGTLEGASMVLDWSEPDGVGTTSNGGTLDIVGLDCSSPTSTLEATGDIAWVYTEPGYSCAGVDTIVALPEPGVGVLLAFGLGGLGVLVRRRSVRSGEHARRAGLHAGHHRKGIGLSMLLLNSRVVDSSRHRVTWFPLLRSSAALAVGAVAGIVLFCTAANAQLVSLAFEGTVGTASVVEGIDGEPSGTPTPTLPFDAGDRFVGALTYDAAAPISADFGTFQEFDGALLSVLVYFFASDGTPTSFSASGGAVTWAAFDPVGPIEISNSGPVTGPAFAGFDPVVVSPDFEDPTGFFPSSTLPILDAGDHPADTLFLLFEDSGGESFDVNSVFTYMSAVPEPSFGTALLVGSLAIAALRRSRPVGGQG